eukprot:15977984-Heterocapsa_arctica.AAC.1
MMKEVVTEGVGQDRPQHTSTLKVNVSAATDGEKELPGFAAAALQLTAGYGHMCDAVEIAVLEMKKGEISVVTCAKMAKAGSRS